MVALHPPLSGYPLAFLSLLVVLEVLCLTRFRTRVLGARSIIVVALVISTAASFFSGYQAVSNLSELSERIEGLISQHHTIGRLLLFNVVVLATAYWISGVATQARVVFRALYYLLLTSQLCLTLWVGYLGGELVFEHGIGVKGVGVSAEAAKELLK